MSPEVRRRAFEPFFSTRPRALGLGLPLAQAIARAQGGTLRLDAPAAGRARLVLILSASSTP
jgi:signal transduction histidine kinase